VKPKAFTVDVSGPQACKVWVGNTGATNESGTVQVRHTPRGGVPPALPTTINLPAAPAPTPNPPPNPAPTPRPPSGGICAQYPLPGDAYNCRDFPGNDAQRYHDQCDPNDVNNLDGDNDGRVCE
jgi:hypothetical protein